VKEFEFIEVSKKEKVIKKIKCDTCDTDINETDLDHYYEVETSHALWGNDSIENNEEFEFCSWECLTNHQGKYFAHADDTYEYHIVRENK
jgi:hypothetical protein